MEPLGTITKYYPFIDEESKSILGSLMEQASSYNDFVLRLSETVVNSDVTLNLVFIAALQAWWTRTEESMKSIQDKFRDNPCIRPWGYIHTSSMSDQVRSHDYVVTAIDKALETSLTDWMEVELHLLHSFFHYPSFGDLPSLLEPLEKAKDLIDSNSLLICFEPLILFFEGQLKDREGSRKDSIPIHRRGLELAKTSDDYLYMYLNFEPLANNTMYFDVQESQDLLQEMYDLAEDLEVPYMIAEVLFDSAIAFDFAGEYDLAISSHNESSKILYGGDTVWLALSRIYATLGDGQRALEWADRAFDEVGHLEYPLLYLRKAWALALLKRLDEAEHNLDTAHSLILKTGQEMKLGLYYHVAGVIELCRDDHLAAMDFLEKSHEIMERYTIGIYQNSILLDLARVEVLLAEQLKSNTQSVTPGKWLSTLEKYALDHKLPGIRMQVALLKSEFYKNQGQLKDAYGTLLEALNITDSPGVTTLKKRITAKIQEIEEHLQDEEIAS